MSSNCRVCTLPFGLLAVLAAALLSSGRLLSAADVNWHTGTAFQRALRHTVGLTWSETPLRPALMQLADVQRVAIYLDRRVDPNQVIEFRTGEAPLEEVLQRLATSLGVGSTQLGSVVYIGPIETAAVLAATAELRQTEAKGLSAAARTRYLAMAAMRWDMLAEPREIVDELTRSQQIEVADVEQVPHDLWPQVDLPPMMLTDRLSLVLAGFDLTFCFEDGGRRIRLQPLSREILVERTYRHALDASELKSLIEQFSDSSVRVLRGRLVLRGTPEVHRRMQLLLQPDEPPPETGFDPNTVYTLTITNQPVGAVIKTLEQRGLKFRIDPSLVQQLYTRVSFQVKEAPLDKLLDEALKPADLTFERKGGEITIRKGE
jgi:hypothetical protein